MSESVKKRRRWPWVVLAAVLLLFGGPIAWSFRPLTAVERSLIGTWTSAGVRGSTTSSQLPKSLRFMPNRRWSVRMAQGEFREIGSWDAGPTDLRRYYDVQYYGVTWLDRLRNAVAFAGAHSDPLRTCDSGHLMVDGREFSRDPE